MMPVNPRLVWIVTTNLPEKISYHGWTFIDRHIPNILVQDLIKDSDFFDSYSRFGKMAFHRNPKPDILPGRYVPYCDSSPLRI